jgi:hypothetical protein
MGSTVVNIIKMGGIMGTIKSIIRGIRGFIFWLPWFIGFPIILVILGCFIYTGYVVYGVLLSFLALINKVLSIFFDFGSGVVSNWLLMIIFIPLGINVIKNITEDIYRRSDSYIWKRFVNIFRKLGSAIVSIVDTLTGIPVFLCPGILYDFFYNSFNIITYIILVYFSKKIFGLLLGGATKLLTFGEESLIDLVYNVIESGIADNYIDILAIGEIVKTLISSGGEVNFILKTIYIILMILVSGMLYLVYFSTLYTIIEIKFKHFYNKYSNTEYIQ